MYAFARHLPVRLPDTLDALLWSDIRGYCRAAWREAQEFDREPRLQEILWHWLMDKIFFGRRARKVTGTKELIDP